MTYSPETLAAYTGESPDALRRLLSINGTAWTQAIADGWTLDQAERYALRLGLHPAEVWLSFADDVLDALRRPCACPGCEERFLPEPKAGQARLYCSVYCRRRATRLRADEKAREKVRDGKRRYRLEVRSTPRGLAYDRMMAARRKREARARRREEEAIAS